MNALNFFSFPILLVRRGTRQAAVTWVKKNKTNRDVTAAPLSQHTLPPPPLEGQRFPSTQCCEHVKKKRCEKKKKAAAAKTHECVFASFRRRKQLPFLYVRDCRDTFLSQTALESLCFAVAIVLEADGFVLEADDFVLEADEFIR